MRKEVFRSDAVRALALLGRAPTVHLATTTPEGQPVLRALDAVVLGDGVYFHGARAGEKTRCLGRPAVVSAEELVAHLPSWMTDPVRGCPATTLYRSVQVHGTLSEVADPSRKAQALEALVLRWQAPGRHQPITADHPLYRGEVEGTLVLRVDLARVDGKDKHLQNRKPEEVTRILAGLWERGEPGDPAAIEAIRAANPTVPLPPFLSAPEGLTLSVALGDGDAAQAEALLAGEYWWSDLPRALIAPAQRAATAWVGARDPAGRLVAMARAVADGRNAGIYDVVVEPSHRGRGLGKRILELLLDHPAVRRALRVRLTTRDAQAFYARFGFADAAASRRWPGASDLILDRTGGRPGAAR
jgi:nitroimidazol reductase NimA-like FMN-containing flavoprotein (pyridoxamine 5'-phosphate oxidase superfamily)/ribosomal protein S18 acetylase RimI-like enzyme